MLRMMNGSISDYPFIYVKSGDMLKVVNKDIFILYIEIHRNKDIIFETTF